MKLTCLAVGICETEGLDYLPGAINGAEGFATWAKRSGYETVLLTDKDGSEVTVERIRDALLTMLPRPRDGKNHGGPVNPPDRLLVYFAGHGLAKDAYEDLWLLSRTKFDQNAIGISALWRRLHTYGVRQVGIFSDACRSLAARDWNFDLTVNAALPLGVLDSSSTPVPHVDLFKASAKLKEAFMLPGESDADSRCIFTGVLLEGLHGTAVAPDDPFRVTNYSLANYLDHSVPSRAREYRVEMLPETTTGFRPADHIYTKLDGQPPPEFPPLPPWPEFSATRPQGSTATDENAEKAFAPAPGVVARRPIIGRITRSSVPTDMAAGSGGIDTTRWMRSLEKEQTRAEDAQRADKERGERIIKGFEGHEQPEHFEAGSGIAILGADVAAVHVGPGANPVRTSRTWWQIELTTPTWLLIELADGRYVGGASMPGLIGNFLIGETGCEGVTYRPSGYPLEMSRQAERAIAAMHAGALSSDAAWDLAMDVRHSKHTDLTLGVLAAYIYDAKGDWENIRRMAWFYSSRGQPIPYDLALLGMLPSLEKRGNLRSVVPPVEKTEPRTEKERGFASYLRATDQTESVVLGRFPWMRQAWPLLGSGKPPLVLEGISEVRGELQSAPFTTLSRRGGAALLAILRSHT